MLPLLTGLALAADVTVTADRIVIDGDHVLADGSVEVRADDMVATAASAELDGDRLVLVDADWTPCVCDGVPPWSVRARQATLEADAVRLRGATVEVLGVPVLPLPRATVPLTRRSGLLAPQLGLGDDGLKLAQPAYFTLGRSADLTLTPELRTARSARMHGEARYALRGGGGEVWGAAGHDWADDAARGAAAWDHAWARDRLVVVSTGHWTGDPDYDVDYGDSYLDRARPYDEARALLAGGRLELSGAAASAPDAATRHLALGVYEPAGPVPLGFLGAASIEARLAQGAAGPTYVVASRYRLERTVSAGPATLTAVAAAEGLAANDGSRIGAVAGIDARLPAWRLGDGFLEHLEPRLTLLYGGTVVSGRLDPDAGAPKWSAAPGLLYRRTGPVTVEAAGTFEGRSDGWRAHARALVQGGPWSGHAHGAFDDDGPDTAVARLQWRGTWLRASAGWAYAPLVPLDPALHQVRGASALTLGSVEVSLSAAADAQALAWLHRGAGLRWTHRSGCLSLGLDGWLDADRTRPDLAVVIEVSP